MDKILRVNMTSRSFQTEPLPPAYQRLGGRAITSRIVSDEVDPCSDPLGPRNKLVFAPGLLSGTVISSSSRLSVGCKSPFGQSGAKMAMLGYRALIVEGQALESGWWVLVVDREGASFERFDHLAGLRTSEAAAQLFERFGPKVGLSLIGPAGQMLMNIAGIGRAYHAELRTQPATAERYPQYGTAATLEVVNKFGGLPIRNFSRGQDPRSDAISGLRMREIILERGGETTHSCMTGCAIQCSNVYVDPAGKEIASSMEFETNGLLGANLEIFDFDAIARFTRWCNELGVDTIETGAAMGVAMEAGLIPWGDVEGVERLFQEILTGTPAGRLCGMGADHTAGNTIGAKTDHLNPADKVALSRESQISSTLLDAFGFCVFARGVLVATPETFAGLYAARFGEAIAPAAMQRYAVEIIKQELQFNVRAGQPAVERLPEWMLDEGLPPHDAVFDVSEEAMARMWEE